MHGYIPAHCLPICKTRNEGENKTMENVASYYKFYRIPKRFFKEEQFRDMTNAAKVLYGILLDLKCLYEDAKENAAFERCTDVITNMIMKYGPVLKRKWAVEEWLRSIHVECFWKELVVNRYRKYAENMKKWKFVMKKSAA